MDPPSRVSKGSLPEIWPFPLARDTGAMLGVHQMARSGRNSGFSELGANRDASAEESTVTEQSGRSCNRRKRRDLGTPASLSEDESSKLLSNSSGNELTDSEAKRVKVTRAKDENGDSKPEVEASSGICNKSTDQSAQPEAPKQDYIHVRVRRGQATDSHSLAERARREKISERMKILQDLVPGCNKVIGKSLVLDEIINYIQSLQHQVEFLSMKLEAVNSRVSTGIEAFQTKGFGIQTLDTASGLAFGSQTTRQYGQESSPEWLHMQVGGGFERAS